MPAPVAAVFDPVGGPSLARSRRVMKPSGVVVSYGFSFATGSGYTKVGAMTRTVGALLRVKLTPGPRVVVHTVARAVDKDPAGFRADIAALVEQLAAGAIEPEVVTLPLEQAAEAHRRLEHREVEGKFPDHCTSCALRDRIPGPGAWSASPLHPHHDRLEHLPHGPEVGREQRAFRSGDVGGLAQSRPVQPPARRGRKLP